MAESSCVLKVEGLDCPVEANALRAALDGSPGVDRLEFDLIRGVMTVVHRGEITGPADLIQRIKTRAGMKASVVDDSAAPSIDVILPAAKPAFRLSRWTTTLGSGAALGLGVFFWAISAPKNLEFAAYLISVAIGGLDLFPKAIRSVGRRQLDIHVLMGLAVVGAAALGDWAEAATVAFLFGLSESLEALSVSRARTAIRALLEIEPEDAERISADGAVELVKAGALHVGDRVRIRAGGRVPVDARVTAGRSSVDQKMITGESTPILREVGDPIFAGTINGDGALEAIATAEPGATLVAKIVASVGVAQANRMPIERSIGRFAALYTPLVVGVAGLVMLAPPVYAWLAGSPPGWAASISRGLVVLVVACPCALVIATPVAVAAALAAAARRGVLIKGGSFLEEFGRLRVLAFDKTGTLTRGEPDVVEVVPARGEEHGDELLRIAAALSDQGGHVLGRAIARHARARRIDVPIAEAYAAVPGLGASGTVESVEYHIGSHRYIDEAGLCPPEFHDRFGLEESSLGTAVALTAASGPLGWIKLADHPRPEAAAVVLELHKLGVETLMLTGDNSSAADLVADRLGIVDRRSGLLPADKATLITALNRERGPTGMVGDGVNDAPALAAARVSVSLGGASSPAAIETADVVLMADDLSNLPWLVRHSRATIARIRQNIALALGAKLVVMILAAFSLATLGVAILADVGITAIVTANALRLLNDRA